VPPSRAGEVYFKEANMKKTTFILIAASVLVTGLVSCERLSEQTHSEPFSDEIVFQVKGISLGADVETKATAVTASDLTTFAVNCVNGTPGSDAEVWSNVVFTKDGSVWKGGKWWPLSNPSYRFYATYPSTYTMTYAAGGPTISASTTHDIVAAYASAPTYKSSNTLSFDHIFARVKNMTVTATGGYTISNVTINITPKVSGTYNLYAGAGHADGTGWSSTATGSAVNLANATAAAGGTTKTNDLYLVPGTYTLTASWRAVKDQYTEDFENMTVDVALVAGKTNNISVNLTGNGTEIVLSVSVTDWSDNAVDGGTFPVVDLVEENSLSGDFTIDEGGTKVKFSKGNLWAHVASGPTDTYNYAADEWGFHTNQWDYCNHGLAVGNTVDHFGWVGETSSYDTYGLCSNSDVNNAYYGTGDSEALKTDWGDIPGVISACGDGWYSLSVDEWGYVFDTRNGGTVGGTSSARWTQGTIRTDVSGVNGIILFPDGCSIAAGEFTTLGTLNDESAWETKCSAAEWTALEAKGCVFLPAAGFRDGGVYDVGVFGYYWSSSPDRVVDARVVYFSSGDVEPQDYNDRLYGFSVRLVHGL